jgi:hypothetical protein
MPFLKQGHAIIFSLFFKRYVGYACSGGILFPPFPKKEGEDKFQPSLRRG